MRNLFAVVYLICIPVTALAAGDPGHGKQLYQVYCTQCHGLQGNGKGINAADMAVMPRDHTDTGEMSARSDDDLKKVIEGGGKAINKSVLMPNWGFNLEEGDVSDLVAYLRVLCCQK